MTSKILFIDDHEIVRLGLRQMLLGTEMEIADEASTSEEGYNKFLTGKYRPRFVGRSHSRWRRFATFGQNQNAFANSTGFDFFGV